MDRIIIDLRYGCYPIWISNEDGVLVNNDLPLELAGEKEIDEAFLEIQDAFENLFIKGNDKTEYLGFCNEADKIQFLEMIDHAINMIRMKTADLYTFEKRFDIEKL